MKEKCSYADKYKAIRKPTCGCNTCNIKWNLKISNNGTTITNSNSKMG
jgi:hypothetical protein